MEATLMKSKRCFLTPYSVVTSIRVTRYQEYNTFTGCSLVNVAFNLIPQLYHFYGNEGFPTNSKRVMDLPKFLREKFTRNARYLIAAVLFEVDIKFKQFVKFEKVLFKMIKYMSSSN